MQTILLLDLMGKRTKEEVFNAGNVLVQRKHCVFDSLSRLATELNAANTAIAAYTYDGPSSLLKFDIFGIEQKSRPLRMSYKRFVFYFRYFPYPKKQLFSAKNGDKYRISTNC